MPGLIGLVGRRRLGSSFTGSRKYVAGIVPGLTESSGTVIGLTGSAGRRRLGSSFMGSRKYVPGMVPGLMESSGTVIGLTGSAGRPLNTCEVVDFGLIGVLLLLLALSLSLPFLLELEWCRDGVFLWLVVAELDDSVIAFAARLNAAWRARSFHDGRPVLGCIVGSGVGTLSTAAFPLCSSS